MPNRNTNAEFTVAQKPNKAIEQTAVNRLFLIFFLPFLYQDKKGNIKKEKLLSDTESLLGKQKKMLNNKVKKMFCKLNITQKTNN